MPLKVSDPTAEPTLNLTPMIDIVFLLIIFFMVGTQFAKQERRFDVQLPTVANAQPLTSRPDDIVINAIQRDTVVIDGEELTLQQLETRLKEAKQNYGEQSVVVRGSGPDPYQLVIDALATCDRAQISHISLATTLSDEVSTEVP